MRYYFFEKLAIVVNLNVFFMRQQAFNCHFDHFMKCIDASKLQFEVGEETGRGGQDYVVPFNYDSDKDKLTINFNGKIRTLKRK